MLRLVGAGLLALLLPAAAHGSAIVESLKGGAQVGAATVRQGERIFTGASLTTAPGAQVRLRFDDGMQIILGENSRLRLVDFRYANSPSDRVVLDLLAGAGRVITGGIARTNPSQFFLRTPQASFSLLGPSDFSVVVSDGSYVSVARGRVIAANRAATVSLVPGPAMAIASGGSTPEQRILPPTALAAFTTLGTTAAAPSPPTAVEAAPPAQTEARAEPARPVTGPPPTVSAAAPRPPRLDTFVFAGASGGASNIDDAMTRGLITTGEVKSDSTGFKVFGGWQFHRYLGVEAAFVDLGEAKYEGTFNGAPVVGGRLKVNGLNFSAVARLPLGNRFALFAKGGVFVWEAEAKDTTGGVSFTSKTDGTGASGGIGASFEITRNIELRTEAEIFGIGDGDKAALFSLGFALMF